MKEREKWKKKEKKLTQCSKYLVIIFELLHYLMFGACFISIFFCFVLFVSFNSVRCISSWMQRQKMEIIKMKNCSSAAVCFLFSDILLSLARWIMENIYGEFICYIHSNTIKTLNEISGLLHNDEHHYWRQRKIKTFFIFTCPYMS